ncbi:hypothetical protein K0M31_009930 [Melipona bicolor]|uniref:Uncharacterized protein n=1 Tax=Melipona bicolor TaxID=60889 RepID=A0AA40FMU7_9HYME|nr:hypothetical protein K0M31_009930 [Melipona bicolor]
MVCDCAASECSTEVGEDASLKRALEELLKCMLRVWCREGQALTRLGADAHAVYTLTMNVEKDELLNSLAS